MKYRIIEKSNNRSPKFCGIHMAKSGLISIYRVAIEKIQLSEGDHIAIIQDEAKPDDFYLVKMNGKQYPRLRSNSSKRHLEVSYVDAYKVITAHFGLEHKGYRIQIGGSVKTDLGSAFVMITSPLKSMGKEAKNEP